MAEQARLVADAMLGSLARKLRIFGFDTIYFHEGPDSDLLRLVAAERRVLLTSDRGLVASARSRGLPVILIQGRTERARLASLEDGARGVALDLGRGASRCALCNTILVPVKRAQVRSRVPAAVAARHRAYYRCPRCDRLYWKGGHWKRLRRLSSMLPRQQFNSGSVARS